VKIVVITSTPEASFLNEFSSLQKKSCLQKNSRLRSWGAFFKSELAPTRGVFAYAILTPTLLLAPTREFAPTFAPRHARRR
jgi:hypothetical protein